MADVTLENLMSEDRVFPPSPEFVAAANAGPEIYEEAADSEAWWMKQALDRISWYQEPTIGLNADNAPFYKWFEDGKLTLSYNCLDRHLDTIGDKIAYHWVGEPGDTRDITYSELHKEVSKFANALKSLGVEKGDRVAVYMGMVPELPITMLACARIGAVHSVCFGGFSSDSLADRIQDGAAKVLVTQDGSWRKGSIFPLKDHADVSVTASPTIEHVVVVERTKNEVSMTEGRDFWWHDLMEGQSEVCELAGVIIADPQFFAEIRENRISVIFAKRDNRVLAFFHIELAVLVEIFILETQFLFTEETGFGFLSCSKRGDTRTHCHCL